MPQSKTSPQQKKQDQKPAKIWLSSPHMGGTELDYVHDAFDKNWIAPLGSNVNGFEEDLCSYTGAGNAAVLTSGTAAIHLALVMLDVQPGDEVICQSFTFSATCNPIRYQQATPVFVDSEPDTWNMCPELLEEAIRERIQLGKKPKAVILVHLYGMPAKMDEIMRVCDRYGIPVIEDAAEALGSSYKGKKLGTFGKFGVLSFNGNKIITTSGGGALLSDDKKLIEKARFLSTQARDKAPHYQHSEVGYNYRMSNIVAGIGRGQMEVLDERVEARRANHEFYLENMEGEWLRDSGSGLRVEEGSLPPTTAKRTTDHSEAYNKPRGIYFLREPEGHFSNRWLSTIIVEPEETGGVSREDIRLALERENIEARPLWKPMHKQPVFEDFPAYTNGVSEELFEKGLCLPSGSNLSEGDLKRVVWNGLVLEGYEKKRRLKRTK